MDKKLKIFLISLGIVGVSVGAFFAIKFYNLKKAYDTKVTPEEAVKIIQKKVESTLDSPEIEEDEYGTVQKASGDRETGIISEEEQHPFGWETTPVVEPDYSGLGADDTLPTDY